MFIIPVFVASTRIVFLSTVLEYLMVFGLGVTLLRTVSFVYGLSIQVNFFLGWTDNAIATVFFSVVFIFLKFYQLRQKSDLGSNSIFLSQIFFAAFVCTHSVSFLLINLGIQNYILGLVFSILEVILFVVSIVFFSLSKMDKENGWN